MAGWTSSLQATKFGYPVYARLGYEPICAIEMWERRKVTIVSAVPVDEARLDAAIEALTDRERFREAEALVGAAAPKLQRVLAAAMEDGGWFDETHESEVRKAAGASPRRTSG